MNRVRNGIGWAALGALWALTAGAPAIADDTEVFRFTPPPGTRANVLFVIDDSISMGTDLLTQPVYNPAVTYPSQGCDTSKVYWKLGTGDPPTCSTTNNYFNLTALKCQKAITDFGLSGQSVYNRVAQYDPSSTGKWRDLDATQKDRVVECQKDDGIHGDGGTATHAYDGGSPAAWRTSSTNVSWTKFARTTFFTGNYVNWWYGEGSLRTRLDVVQNVVDDLVDTLDGVNVGLMDFNTYSFGDEEGSNGGSVSVAMGPVETNRAAMKSAVAALTPSATTPLAETLYEARQYFAGNRVTYGTASVLGARVAGNPNVYDSPIDQACQNNFVVFLTDGEPTYDNQADTAIVGMTDARGNTFANLTGSPTCDVEAWAGVDFASPPGGQASMCFDDVAHFLYQGDQSALDDTQRVRTITVGFTVDLPVLRQAAERGNGRAAGDSDGVYFVANNAAQLSSVFSDIIGGISNTTASFASPAVSVNAFNRTENLSDLFISVFRPSAGYHWPGNLKKYRLRDDGAIVDARDVRAVDPATGLFTEGTQSFWTPATVFDGSDVEKGGAASILPTSRLVYTNISGNDLNSTGNRVEVGNSALTAGMLGTTATATAPLRREDLINYINGLNPLSGQPRKQMGDPLHSQPVSFIYGPGLRDGLVFVATNDGYLHALHADTGVEQWAFVPREFLDDQMALMENDDFPGKHYALDGPMRIQMIGDSDGVIETGEKVILYVGMRRGGSVYYALDITNPTDPQVLWRHDETTLVGLGESWSPPVATRVKIGTTEYSVVVIGGGYATNNDADAWTVGGDAVGNSIYIINADAGGTILWRGTKNSGTGVTETFNVSGRSMDYSFPGEIRVLDMNGDKLMDRMYAADMGGQIWRFDVTNGNAAADLVVGGVIAQLGIAGDATPTFAENRRFYYAPDVAFVNTPTQNFIHIGIGSGHREHPLGIVNSDRFYAIRDTNVAHMDQATFNGLSLITEANLRPITTANTTIQTTDKGWRIDLQPGEKVLAEARTIANTVFFTTFRPGATAAACQPQPGFNRLYRVSVYNAAPVTNLDGGLATEPLSMSDMYVENTGSISSTSQVIFVSRDRDGDGIPDDQDPDDDNDGILDGQDTDQDNDGIPDSEDPDDDNDGIPDVDEAAGDQGWACTDRICVPLGFTNAPVRTYWRQTSLD